MKATLKNNPVPIIIYKGTENAQLFRQRQRRELHYRHSVQIAKEELAELEAGEKGEYWSEKYIAHYIVERKEKIKRMKHRYLVRCWALNRIAKNFVIC